MRIFHWSLVTSFAIAWLSARTTQDLHYWAGYVAGGLVLTRTVWGLVGSRYARFSQFVRSPNVVFRYLLAIFKGHERRYLGHNPAGGAMIVVIMIAMLAAVVSGWMMTTDTYFGVTWVARMHSLIVHGLLVLVVIHLSGVLVASLRHRENLVAAMFSGRKREAEVDDVA